MEADSQTHEERVLASPADRITALEIGPLLSTRDLGRAIHYWDEVDSTNAVASRVAAEGASHGEVVIAERQTQGRGRRGRFWASPAGLNLYVSAILRPKLPPQRTPELTLVAATALAELLRESGAPDAAIKWPNDVLIAGRKVAGILTELSADADRVHHVVVGIGVNLNARPEHFPEDVRSGAISLCEARGAPVQRAPFAASLFSRLEQWLDRHAEEGFAPVRERWRSLAGMLGEEILVRTDRSELRGVALDIDETGALLLRKAGGAVERILAGDVEQLRARAR